MYTLSRSCINFFVFSSSVAAGLKFIAELVDVVAGSAAMKGLPSFAITPESLTLCRNGRVEIASLSFDDVRNQNFIPPEYGKNSCYSDEAIEKVNLQYFTLHIPLVRIFSKIFNILKSIFWNQFG